MSRLPKTSKTVKQLRKQLRVGDTIWTLQPQASWMCPGLPDAMAWPHRVTRICFITDEPMFGTDDLKKVVYGSEDGVYLSQPPGSHSIAEPLPQVAAPNPDLNEWEKAEKWRREAARKAGVR